jgi:hypothetical protein
MPVAEHDVAPLASFAGESQITGATGAIVTELFVIPLQ